MNGYMLVDTRKNEIGLVEVSYRSAVLFRPNSKGKYDVITIPDDISKDYDYGLLQKDYILGINYPVSRAIQNELRAEENRPMRRVQLAAKIGKLKTIDDARALITFTDPDEPLSIFGRWDLGRGTATRMKKAPDGAIDAKVISASMVSDISNLRGELNPNSQRNLFWMKFGTPIIDGEPFIWSKSDWKEQKLRDVPDVLDGEWSLLKLLIR